MLEGERDKLMKMESLLHQRVTARKEAVVAVSNAVRAFPCRVVRPESSKWLVHVPRPDRCG